jgi:hypothetical protein
MENGERLTTTATAERMAGAASAFLGALTEEQRKQACYGFGDERRSWSYLPARDRDGLPIGALDAEQRKLGHELIVTGTSMPAYTKVVSVIAMEHVLRAMAPESLGGLFDPDRYCFKVFGSPGEAAWGWQFAGHHVALNFTVADGRYVSPTPCIHHRPPPDLAARMVPKIGETERPDAVFFPEPDYVISDEERDILSYVRASPKGVPASGLNQPQFDSLAALVGSYVRRLPDEVAGAQLHDLERMGMDNLTFAWAGGTSPGDRHYYRVQGPTLLIEHDNTQGNGTHIHSAWRNPADDFGDDVLAEHYRTHHT